MTSVGVTVPLGELVDLVMGQAPPSKDCNFDSQGTPFVKVGEFGEIRPVIREWTTNPLRMAHRADVLLCVVGATCGKINLGEECAIGRSVAAIRPNTKKLDQMYLYYFMMTLVEQLRSGSVGAAQTVISKEMVQSVRIPCHSLPEQKQIVKILDKAFEGIATAKANAEKNLKNAQALFESYLDSIFSNRGRAWEEKKLGEACDVIAGQSPEGKYYNDGGKGLPFYQGKKEFTEKYIGEPTTWTTSITKEALEGDVLMSVRAPVGPINFSTEKICIGRGLAAIRATKLIDKEFLFYFLLNHEKKIIGNAGAVFSSISKSQIESILIPLPPILEQQAIVDKFKSLSKETQRLAALYEHKLTILEALKKSLLHQAFSGELSKVAA